MDQSNPHENLGMAADASSKVRPEMPEPATFSVQLDDYANLCNRLQTIYATLGQIFLRLDGQHPVETVAADSPSLEANGYAEAITQCNDLARYWINRIENEIPNIERHV